MNCVLAVHVPNFFSNFKKPVCVSMNVLSRYSVQFKPRRCLIVSVQARHSLDDEALGYVEKVFVTSAVQPRLFELHHCDMQSTVNTI